MTVAPRLDMMTSEKQQPQVSIVVPAYNEERRIGPTLVRVSDYLERRDLRHEVIVVDDGSRDGTRACVSALAAERPLIRLLPLPQNAGKGAAVRAGVRASRGNLVLFSDADLSTPIEEIERLEAALHAGADIAIGSRAVAGDVERKQPFLRRVQGRAFHLVVRALGFHALATIRDTQCGFKLFRGPVARALFEQLSVSGFAFDVELLELAHRRFRIAEVPVAWTHADGSKVRPGVDAMAMLRDLIRVRRAWSRQRRPALALTTGQRVR